MIPFNLSKLTETLKNNIVKKCVIRPTKTQYNENPQPIYCFKIDQTENKIYLPMGVWRDVYGDDEKQAFPPTRIYPSAKFNYNVELFTKETDPKKYRDQDVVFKEAITRLKKEHTVFLNLPTGFGKSKTAGKIIHELGVTTAILSYSENIRTQFYDVLKECSDAKIQYVESGQKIKKGMDIYIFGSLAAASLNKEDIDHIGLVVIDEVHQVIETCLTESLFNFQPKYLIGLSATTKRSDGLHKLFELYFGKESEYIYRKEIKNFTICKVNTPFKPDIKYRLYKGKNVLDMVTVANSLAYNNKRNDFIINLIKKHPERIIYVLVDRVYNCKYVFDKLKTLGIDVGIIIGKETKTPQEKEYYDSLTPEGKKEFNRKKKEEQAKYTNKKPLIEYKVIVSTKQAGGTGIDIKTLDMGIIAFSTNEINQFEGRVRVENCIIYDLVDDLKTLEAQWNKRKKWYSDKGATIKYLELDFNGNLRTNEIFNENKKEEHKRLIPVDTSMENNEINDEIYDEDMETEDE